MKENTSRLYKIRQSLLLSRSELARKADVSPITIARIEEGKACRMETQRKILRALGFDLSDKHKVFD
jgi:predicted transcriptional regulator